MINFYINRIQCGIMTLEDIPSLWCARVQKALEETETQRGDTL